MESEFQDQRMDLAALREGGEGRAGLECGNQCKLAVGVVLVLHGIAENVNAMFWVLHKWRGFGGSRSPS